MNLSPAIHRMLTGYPCKTRQDYVHALKEIIQEVALLGLWRAKFFDHAAFYGGTALRIFYGLDRFSEDLDFSLLKKSRDFKLSPYLKAVKEELEALGFEVSLEKKKKNIKTAIESAFIKANTREHLLKTKIPTDLAKLFANNHLLQIKLEIDTQPPGFFKTEAKSLLVPIPFSVRNFQLPDLFAGKIHAILMRPWVKRVKGRDFYDFIWYRGQQTPVRIKHLEARLKQSGAWKTRSKLTKEKLIILLQEKFSKLHIAAAKKDVEPFIKDTDALKIWSRDFFVSLLQGLEVV